MYVQIAGTPEKIVFEVMIFKVSQPVRHVPLARQETAFPKYSSIANDPGFALDVFRQGAQQQLRADGTGPQF